MVHPEINKYTSYGQPVNGEKIRKINKVTPETIFEKINTSFEKNADDDFIDFYSERGIAQMHSHEGPKAAVADVNGDGLDDVYIGGTVSKPGQYTCKMFQELLLEKRRLRLNNLLALQMPPFYFLIVMAMLIKICWYVPGATLFCHQALNCNTGYF